MALNIYTFIIIIMDGESGELMEPMEEVLKNVLYCTVKRTKKINTVKPAKVDDPLK